MPEIYVYGAAIFNEAGLLLIVRRASHEDQYPDYWELPGGKAESGETPEQAVIREILEETGLSVRAIEGEYFRFSYRDVLECHYRVSVTRHDVELNPDEHSEFKWIKDVHDLDGILMTQELKRSIAAVLSS